MARGLPIPTLLVAAALSGCGGGIDTPPSVRSESRALFSDGLTADSGDGIDRNGLDANGLLRNGIDRQALVGAGLDGQQLSTATTAYAVAFMSYVVSCALPLGTSADVGINGGNYHLTGSDGLAPGWRTDACDATCQRWVTACLLARTNYYGEHVMISMRGSNPALGPGLLGQLQYSLQEGAFYGNLFADQPELRACMGTMFDNPGLGDVLGYLQRRICASESFDQCPFQAIGPCRPFITPPWSFGSSRACEGLEHDRRAVYPCHPDLGAPFVPNSTAYQESITVFLDPTRLPLWILQRPTSILGL